MPAGASHQPEPVDVDRLPIVPVDLERESLLAPHGVDHDRPPVLTELEHPSPCKIAYSRRQCSDEHAWGDFKEPSREVATQTGGARSEDDDYHSSVPG